MQSIYGKLLTMGGQNEKSPGEFSPGQ